jgi:hypothetical protein
MFFGKNPTPEQIQFRNQIMTFILVQGAIFSTLLLVNRITKIDYGVLLFFAGLIIVLVLIPSNLELNSYVKSANSMGGHQHSQILEQMLKLRMGWRESIERFIIGLIPFSAGVILLLI